MAKSPAHRLGQIVGDALEGALRERLETFCKTHGFLLDSKGLRAARPGRKVTWKDALGNKHDLDFVIEKGGTRDQRGDPVAFIEVAFRRYTKHSKNKVQEVQSAIDPMVATYPHIAPFKGAVLAGDFTEPSIRQLKTNGYHVAWFDYPSVVQSFASVGLDVATDEDSPDRDVLSKVAACERDAAGVRTAGEALYAAHRKEMLDFLGALQTTVIRDVRRVVVIPLFGEELIFKSVAEALARLDAAMAGVTASTTRHGYEVLVEYRNGDAVRGRFAEVAGVRSFLEKVG